MEETQILQQLEELLELDAGTIQVSSLLADLPGWDSMAILGFISMTDEAFGVSPSPKAIAGCRTVAELLAVAMPK